MGFWPFGREPRDVELASRVVTATTRDGRRIRGKLTVHFAEGQTQAEADAAADRYMDFCARVLAETATAEEMLGRENDVVESLLQRLPGDLTRGRVELLSLHVVGAPGSSSTSTRRPSSGTMRAVTAPTDAEEGAPRDERSSREPTPVKSVEATPLPGRSADATPLPNVGRRSSSTSVVAGAPPPKVGRRPSSTSLRAQSLTIPHGAGAPAMGQAIAPTIRDGATRLLVGALHAYDLLALRKIALDELSPDMLEALVPVPDAAVGKLEESRKGELERWRGQLGDEAFDKLQREASTFAVYLAYAALIEAHVPQALAIQITEAACAGGPAMEHAIVDLGRYLRAEGPEVADELANHFVSILRAEATQESLVRALAPLLGNLREELGVVATIVRAASS